MSNVYGYLATECRLSESTVRNAFARKPVSERTARKLMKRLELPLDVFVIKPDHRGRPSSASRLIAKLQKSL